MNGFRVADFLPTEDIKSIKEGKDSKEGRKDGRKHGRMESRQTSTAAS